MERRPLIYACGIIISLSGGIYAADIPMLNSPGCLEQVQQVCKEAGLEVNVCLETQGGRISQECREQFKESQVMMNDSHGAGACATDLQSLCPATSVHAIQKCIARQIEHMPARCRTLLAGLPPM